MAHKRNKKFEPILRFQRGSPIILQNERSFASDNLNEYLINDQESNNVINNIKQPNKNRKPSESESVMPNKNRKPSYSEAVMQNLNNKSSKSKPEKDEDMKSQVTDIVRSNQNKNNQEAVVKYNDNEENKPVQLFSNINILVNIIPGTNTSAKEKKVKTGKTTETATNEKKKIYFNFDN